MRHYTFYSTKNGAKKCPSQRNEKKISSLFSSFPHLDFEVNLPPDASGHISTLKMSRMVEILLSDLLLIVNQYGKGKHRVSTRISKMCFLKQKAFLKKQYQFVYNLGIFQKFDFLWIVMQQLKALQQLTLKELQKVKLLK